MLKQHIAQKQLQKLSPQQIQFIQLLQLNSTEFEKRVEEELTENPAIESDRPENEERNNDENEEFSNNEDFEEGGNDELESALEEYDYEVDVDDYVGDDYGNDYSYDVAMDPNEERKEIPFASVSTLYDNLFEQLSAMRLNDRQKELARHLIGMVEEDGYLRRPLKNIAYDLAFLNSLQTNEQELEEILRRIQAFDPAGIAARSLQECLLLQLDRKEKKDDTWELARKVVAEYMDDLGKKHYEKLLRGLKIDRERLRDVVDVIIHLNPKPGESSGSSRTQYVIPDFLVTSSEGELHVTLNNKNAPELRVNKTYHNTLKGFQEAKEKTKNQKEQVQFIKQKLDSAKWFIEAIKQRQNTLLQTMKTIVEYQKDFFLTGDIEELNPMILKDIADRIGMDISTVSRVANSKYVQTDFGIFPLKEFFSEGITTESGEEVSNKEVKKILSDMIEGEEKRKPLTDEKLTNMLNDRGYQIARRTVAKYREQMNIPVARLRKEI